MGLWLWSVPGQSPFMPLEVSTSSKPKADAQRAGVGNETLVEAALRLEGLHCAACANVIESAIQALAGVEAVWVHGAQQRARVRWNPGLTDLSSVIQAIRRAGYLAEIDRGQGQQQARCDERKRLLWQLFVAWFCAMQVMMLARRSL